MCVGDVIEYWCENEVFTKRESPIFGIEYFPISCRKIRFDYGYEDCPHFSKIGEVKPPSISLGGLFHELLCKLQMVKTR